MSVVMPFGGPGTEFESARSNIEAIRVRAGDELILVVNGEWPGGPPCAGGESGSAAIVQARGQRSSYYARNHGAERAVNPWLLFIDADCEPPADLLDRYFAIPLPDRCGVVAGGVAAAAAQGSFVGRYARARGHIDESWHVDRKPLPAGVTANLMVRRAAFESLGGFHEGIRSGGDVELCWRLQEAGWAFAHRPEARVAHRHPDSLRAMLGKTRRHAAGRLWVNRRYAGAYERPRLLLPLARASGGALVRLAQGRAELARFKALDAAWHIADVAGYALGDNRASSAPAATASRGPSRRRVLFMTDAAPARSETFVYSEWDALERLGLEIRMEASARAARSDRAAARSRHITYLENDPPLRKVCDLAWLLARHPLRSGRDLRERGSWSGEDSPWPLSALAPAARRLSRGGEVHIHVHFAGPAALHALRLGRLVGVPYSVALHGYDVYQRPRNLALKLRGAAFATAACEYMARDLRTLAPAARDRIEVVPMGVDATLFAPGARHGARGRRVCAVGRLVEKKGFADLVEAIAILHERDAVESLLIIGDGPLRAALESKVRTLRLDGVVEIRDAWGVAAIRDAIGSADVMAVPSVVAADGDRDSMPVVAKEAMAMEVPVVASDEVGLPELVDASCGRLVPPGNPVALAATIGELLELPEERLREIGAMARRVVLERFTVEAEASAVAASIEAAGRRRAQSIGLR